MPNMKTPFVLARFLLVPAATFTPLTGAPAESPTATERIPFPARSFVERGMKREAACNLLGAPSAELSPDLWVYFDFNPVNPRFRGIATDHFRVDQFDTVVVGFANDRVVLIRLCHSKPVHDLIARQQREKADGSMLASR
jgi:hypothetical protein